MLECFALLCNLNGQFSCRSQDHDLRSTLTELLFRSKLFDHGQAKAECLTRASQVSNNQVFSTINSLECIGLNREEIGDTSSLESIDGSLTYLREVSVVALIHLSLLLWVHHNRILLSSDLLYLRLRCPLALGFRTVGVMLAHCAIVVITRIGWLLGGTTAAVVPRSGSRASRVVAVSAI